MSAKSETKHNNVKACIARPFVTTLDWINRHQVICIWAIGVLYKFVLDAMYIGVGVPAFSYAGLVYAPNILKYILAFALYVGVFYLLPKKEGDIISFLLHLQFALTVAPMLCFYALADQSSAYMIMVVLCVVLQIVILRKPILEKKASYIKGMKKPTTVIVAAMIVATVGICLLYNGFEGLKAFDFDYIYEMRENAQYPFGVGYLLNWITRTIIPFLVLWCVHKKKYLYAIGLTVVEVLFYMLTGEKFILFILLPTLAIYFLSRSRHLIKLMYGGMAAVFGVVSIAYPLIKDIPLGVRLCRLVAVRTIFHPADNKFNFYELFSEFPRLHFSDGLIGKMFGMTYPYAGTSGQVIYAYTGGDFLAANSNTGYLGEAYGQFGFLGMLAMSLLLALLLRLLRHYEKSEYFPVLTALFSVYMIILNDAALFTTIFSGGMAIAFALMMIFFEKDTGELPNGIYRI